ncbi:MAG: hypothetical protein LUC98_04945, partial [Lachnospiraceae bacterium]|nr:hypothetical protein [Lachnospiraceae bacterium]
MKKKWIKRILSLMLAVSLTVGDSGVVLATESTDTGIVEEMAETDEPENGAVIDGSDVTDNTEEVPEGASDSESAAEEAAQEPTENSSEEASPTDDENPVTEETAGAEESENGENSEATDTTEEAESADDETIELTEVDTESAEVTETEVSAEDSVPLLASNSASEYALVLTGNDSQAESHLDETAYMEFDKYLVQNEEVINNQSTYDIYMETAYLDASAPEAEARLAPERRDVIIIIDQSLTMNIGSRIADTNAATAAFFKNAAAINNKYMAAAKNGEYSDVDPASDVEAQMQDHLIHVVGIMGYNNDTVKIMYRDGWDGLAPTSSNDIAALTGKAHFDASCLLQGTYTDVALAYAYNNWIYSARAASTDIILITDGGATDMTHANDALTTARKIKDGGTTIYGVYVYYGNCNALQTALLTGNIDDVPAETDTEVWKIYAEHMVSAVFMSLCASDYPRNGTLGTSGRYYNYTYSYGADSGNHFGKYSFFTSSGDGIVKSISSIPGLISNDATASVTESGYASGSSYFTEEITDPFEITDESAITVYQVPWVPANLNEKGIPTDMDEKGNVAEFRWGEQYTYDENGDYVEYEWEDITDQVSCTVIGNTIKVTGYDYEANAVTNYDKDCVKYWTSMITEDDRKYEPGDYGYKLILVVGINAKTTFGGNKIATNNPDTTAFYPSTPNNSSLPVWTENTGKNPNRNSYIEKYPVPVVDLKVTYAINSDSIIIYAPQTAELLNLVTDDSGVLWYTDPMYSKLKTENDNAYAAYLGAVAALQDAKKAAAEDTDNSALQEAAETAEMELYLSKTAYLEANDALSAVANYTPNGINNAFVDILYTLTDPNGTAVGTLTIPHGTEYYVNESGEANLTWNFTQDNITISGEYTITCTVTPVDTVRSPIGHVYVTSDDDATKTLYPYSSTAYSSTGSTADGSQKSCTVKETTTAYIFQLEVTAADTRLRKGQTLDFNEGNEPLLTGENPHIVSYRWVCTDGVTASDSADEPGITGLMRVGGGVTVTSQIPEAADAADETVEDALVKIVSGTKVTNAENGGWVPVSVILSRMTGNLNKSASTTEQVTQKSAYMTDSDQLYGEGVSSVIWNHECEIITSYDCNDEDFAAAQATYNTAEDETGRGTVRYLIHVEENPLPKVTKSTDTEVITMGDDIVWNVQVSNTDETTNPDENASDFSMVDVLPYTGDGRIDPDTNHEGSSFSGKLCYVSVILDSSGSETTLSWLKSERAGLYYTTDTAVREADEQKVLGTAGSGNIQWTKASSSIDGSKVVFSVPADAVAVKFATRLLWKESIRFTMTANLTDLTDQQVNDCYHNQAYVTTGNGLSNSEVVVTTVANLYISGTAWEDTDANGLMLETEPGVNDVIVTLYKLYDENNGGDVDRTIDGVRLVRAYDKDGNMFSPILTDSTGNYSFQGVTSGTYYLVFDYIPEQYEITAKQVGNGDASAALIDSEAEETFLTDQDELLAGSAWIKEIRITKTAAENQNLGLKNILGTIIVYKTLNEICFPSTLTEEERNEYRLTFVMQLKSADTGKVYSGNVVIDDDNKDTATVSCSFRELPLGTYYLTEAENALYGISDVKCDSKNIHYDDKTETVTITLTSDESELALIVNNTPPNTPPPPGGDGPGGAANWINMRIPVSLELIYSGSDPISSESLTAYTFTAADFDPGLGGDIIVTYDDGSTISLSAGTLNFSNITLSPSCVTNRMNSDEPVVVTGYYSEKGQTLKDTFRVTVDLKPVHKFQLNFDANGSTFANGSARNVMMFGYDEDTASNYVTSGTYKDADNGGLLSMGDGYVFAGWNTKDDGTGIQYDSYTSLNAIGADTSIDTLTLYANWKTYVTFDANKGKIAGGITAAELAIVEEASGSILYNVNQVMATALIGSRENYHYVLWNTRADGTGTNLENYGKITESVTFYAIYYQSDYTYTGDAQEFLAPVDGWYEVQLWGAQGGNSASSGGKTGGKGAYVSGRIHLTAGTLLYVYVGGPGLQGGSGSTGGAGYNGGGISACGCSGSGGGATDIRTVKGSDWDDYDSLASRIAVAAGGGGAGSYTNYTNGGYGGALVGGVASGSAIATAKSYATQSQAGLKGSFGKGGALPVKSGTNHAAGGGGGWYGGGAKIAGG